MVTKIPLIDDPLEWQEAIDSQCVRLNCYGSDRFWATAAELLGVAHICRDGAPDCSEILIPLQPGVALRLYTEPLEGDEGSGYRPLIRYEFVALTDGE